MRLCVEVAVRSVSSLSSEDCPQPARVSATLARRTEAPEPGADARERRRRTADCDCEALRGELERESEARAELLSVVSHELRTPLAVISGYSRLLLDERVGPLTEEQRRFVAESKRSCERLDALVTRLLGASSGGFETTVPEFEIARVEPIVEQVIGFFAPQFDERELELSLVRGLDPLPAVRLDRSRTEQVLTNLLGNALKYANPGGCVEVGCAAPSPERGEIEVTVSDDGPGIAPGDRERVFEPWVRSGRSGMANGLGLGLAISRGVVEEMGGRIWVEQSRFGGCRFHFTLPIVEGAAPRPDVASGRETSCASGDGAGAKRAGGKG